MGVSRDYAQESQSLLSQTISLLPSFGLNDGCVPEHGLRGYLRLVDGSFGSAILAGHQDAGDWSDAELRLRLSCSVVSTQGSHFFFSLSV